MGFRAKCVGLLLAFGLTGVALAATPDAASVGAAGRWDRDDGLGGVVIAPCGAALCGDVTWLKNPEGAARVGERLLYDMQRTAANSWAGKAHNPEDGRDYDGTLTVEGDHMVTRGCVLGFICRSVALTRAR